MLCSPDQVHSKSLQTYSVIDVSTLLYLLSPIYKTSISTLLKHYLIYTFHSIPPLSLYFGSKSRRIDSTLTTVIVSVPCPPQKTLSVFLLHTHLGTEEYPYDSKITDTLISTVPSLTYLPRRTEVQSLSLYFYP